MEDDWPSSVGYEILGFVTVNVVQIRRAPLTNRKRLDLVRDGNSIKVLKGLLHVGNIDRMAAEVLSALMESGFVKLQGILPKCSRRAVTAPIPIQVIVYASSEGTDTAKSRLTTPGVNLITAESPLFLSFEEMDVKELRGIIPTDVVSKMFTILELNVRNRVPLVAVEPPHTFMKTNLFSHQKEGLGWLLSREDSELPPFWEQNNGGFVNLITSYRNAKKPQPICGGILADAYGLGKTLMVLSLIACDIVKRVNEEAEEIDSTTTLILCTPSVLHVWENELENHINERCINAYVYNANDGKSADELKQYDIVFLAYNKLVHPENAYLMEIEWHRVVLDEVQMIKNPDCQTSKLAINLKAKRRWAVAGTPLNKFDQYALIAFLRFEPFSRRSVWDHLFRRGDNTAKTRLQVLLASISLRRSKNLDEEPRIAEEL